MGVSRATCCWRLRPNRPPGSGSVWPRLQLRSTAVNVPPGADLYDRDCGAGILYGVPIVAPAEAVLLFAGKLFRTVWLPIVGESFDLRYDATSIFPGQRLQLFGRRGFDKELIACHAASGLSIHPRMT